MEINGWTLHGHCWFILQHSPPDLFLSRFMFHIYFCTNFAQCCWYDHDSDSNCGSSRSYRNKSRNYQFQLLLATSCNQQSHLYSFYWKDSFDCSIFLESTKVTDATFQMLFAVEVWKIKKKQGERKKSPSPLNAQEIKLSAVRESIIHFALLNLKCICFCDSCNTFPIIRIYRCTVFVLSLGGFRDMEIKLTISFQGIVVFVALNCNWRFADRKHLSESVFDTLSVLTQMHTVIRHVRPVIKGLQFLVLWPLKRKNSIFMRKLRKHKPHRLGEESHSMTGCALTHHWTKLHIT